MRNCLASPGRPAQGDEGSGFAGSAPIRARAVSHAATTSAAPPIPTTMRLAVSASMMRVFPLAAAV